MRHRDVARAIAYADTRHGREYLLLKAPKGYWGNPQGGVEPGENPLEAALRELEEETGLTGTARRNTHFSTVYETIREGAPTHTRAHAYAIEVEKGPVTLPEGHTSHAWLPHKDARARLTTYPEQQLIFDEVTSMLREQETMLYEQLREAFRIVPAWAPAPRGA